MKTSRLYLIEFYSCSPSGEPGWDIHCAWVRAGDPESAIARLRQTRGNRFDCALTVTEQAAIVPLAGDFRAHTPDANLFFVEKAL